ncbi:DUF1499 domain-containing protein [Aquicoccus sp. G2-2]|uniref:DUF1499 domain-containing protein n=1 Tax=Aquicoccus sp. G2-2 TaxID=3092120 RepID=UPI002ADF6FB8|nr:DUF1499 domain-containing protein [Aquicoccus sp. G2-2]MEA1112841.1 DUF1499 domain-containing protein [Aquicoccus sp. G2-2]
MGWKMIFILIPVAIVLAFAGYVRLAPSDPARWNQMPESVQTRDLPGGAQRVVKAGPDGLARLDAIARNWPRTRVLAGAIDAGMITYITRSALWGFPDYTTVRQTGDTLEIYARLRFGRSDLGVNGARIKAWLDQL